MIKRMNKVTSLLIAAAAVVSLIPSIGANAATQTLQTQTGTVDSAIAFDGGKFIYDGYRTSDDQTGVYYNAGDKDKQVESFNPDSVTKYGSKYAKVVDGSDEYLIDLTTGQVTDGTTQEIVDSLNNNLKSALKKADRYSSIKNSNGQINSLDQIAQGQFGDAWYKYVADGDVNASTSVTNNNDGTKSTAKLVIPDFANGTTVTFGGKSYVCDNTVVATPAELHITVPTITVAGTTTGTVKFNGKDFAVTTATTQQSLDIAILDEVKKITNGTFDFANASISGDVITVKDSVATEYLPSVLSGLAAKYNTSSDFALAGTQVVVPTTTVAGVAASTTSVGSQTELNNKILADVKANTSSALAQVFDVANATISGGRLVLQTKEAKEYYQSEYNTALTGYTLDGSIVLGTPSTTTTTGGGKVQYIGFTDENAKYIDASYVANMYVYSKVQGHNVKIDNFGKENKDAKLTVNLVSLNAVTQDKDYIYAIATVNVTGDGATEGTQTFFQKISKTRGDQKDGAYLPKTVESYQITSDYNSSDADNAATAINEAQQLRVVNNVLYATKIEANKVTVTTIKLTKDKVALDNGTTKIDAYLAEKTGDDNHDITAESAVSIDTDGNTWAVDKGEILKFDGTKFTTAYNCDRSFDSLDVYNADSLIVWQAGEGAYATVTKQADQTPAQTPTQTPAQNKGWVKTDAGWTFYNNDGSQVKGQWVNDNGTWYMIKADGTMATGWYNDNGTWYFLNASGAMKTGWVNDNGTWYFLNASGAMKTGWLNDNGTWYYLNASGAMLANTVVDGYKLGASGAWVK